MKEGKAWVKLSALYHDSTIGGPTYDDTVLVGRKYVECEENRVLWGTDWPHPSEYSARKPIPNDAQLLNLLAVQAPEEQVRYKILVKNPKGLYGF
jgi:predicted TIM-barrel fold metal-dependent hydrolase